MDARTPERLGGVDVAEPGDGALVEQHGLYGASASLRGRAQQADGEFVGFRAQLEARWIARRVVRCGAEGAGVDQGEALAVIGVERDAGEARHRGRSAGRVPVARHAKVNGKHGAVIEVDVLVLATALDGGDATANEAGRVARGKGATLGGVMCGDRDEAAPDQGSPGDSSRGFDFGEFRHSRR